ncbi:MAG TPA: TIGR04283 family arsenosugar biosynthesis glycosyltransferase [Thermoanaerobaculia bacterium]
MIIPTLNEEEWITGAVESARGAGAAEVIVVDGGSTDRTPRLATAAGARLMLSDRMRARQLNRGSEAASHPSLIFLHADSRLPAGAAAAVEEALARGIVFGGFRLQFAEEDRRLRIAERMINLRSAITRAPWGDQAQFIARDTLIGIGGFRDVPIMEDYELAQRMKRAGPTRILPLTVTTSGRRFLQKGVLRTAAINWSIIWRYHRGHDLQELARLYRR